MHVFILEDTQSGGGAAHMLSQDGQVCHLSADGISLPRSTEGKKNNSTLPLDHTSLQSAFTDGISFEAGHNMRESLSPVRGGLSPKAPKSSSPPKAALVNPYITQDSNPGCSSSCKGRGLF